MVELQYDVNGDGKVDIVDVNALQQKVEDGQDLGMEFDYNQDGKVDIVDVNWLYQNYEELEATDDTSEAVVYNFYPRSNNPDEITVSFGVNNQIQSGDGEVLSGTGSITIDGAEVDTFTFDLQPGKSMSETRAYSGVGSGDKKVCVNLPS